MKVGQRAVLGGSGRRAQERVPCFSPPEAESRTNPSRSLAITETWDLDKPVIPSDCTRRPQASCLIRQHVNPLLEIICFGRCDAVIRRQQTPSLYERE